MFFSKPIPDNKFVFICGLHRSGTSLLQAILREHPDISSFYNTGAPEDEGQFLQTIYPTTRQHGGAGKFCLYAEAPMNEHSPLVSPKNQKKLFTQWSKFWNLEKPVLLEKSPCNIIRSRFLQAMFPNSYFIFLSRHPIVVSYATQKWSETSIPELFSHWSKAHSIMRDDMKHLKRSLFINYETLITKPNETAKTIHEFIGVKPQAVSHPIYTILNDSSYDKWEATRETNPDMISQCKKFEAIIRDNGYILDAPYVKA